MNILICGASGFVGRHLTQHLRQCGHQVCRAVRTPREQGDVAVNFLQDTRAEVWLPRLQHIDVVINTVGVLRDSKAQPMQTLHVETPAALFKACEQAGVKRIVHISALGVDSGVNVPYFSTRLANEQTLKRIKIPTLCLRPSVIYGEDGASAKMFRQMAKLPVLALPMGGEQSMQPVHIEDICQAISNWLAQTTPQSATLSAVGGEPTTMRGMIDSYRLQMGHGPAWHIALPAWCVKIMARGGDFVPASTLCSDTVAMMAAGNTAPADDFSRLLGRAPRSYRHFINAS